MPVSAKVIADSINWRGDRLVTFEGKMHRFVLAEFNTHRMFSRNSASSRAIPIKKQLERVESDPAIPVEWGANRPGMQATDVLSPDDALQARARWLHARDMAVEAVRDLDGLGLHKQVANRLLEPFMWHTVIFSTTQDGLENFFDQRCTSRSPLAQPEMRAFADAVLEAYESSVPDKKVGIDVWHMPYIQPDEVDAYDMLTKIKVSVARCARVSYLTHDGVRDIDKDLELYDKLVNAKPMHASPLEHVALAGTMTSGNYCGGNFEGWTQYRHLIGTQKKLMDAGLIKRELDAMLEMTRA